MKFSCDKCGLCCRHVGDFPYMKDYDRGDGTCKHLTDENLCEIYENRPPICNTEMLYERFFSRFMTRDEYDQFNLESCERIKSSHENRCDNANDIN